MNSELNDELTKLVSDSMVNPLVFIIACMTTFLFVTMILFYRLLPWIPEALAKLVMGAGTLLVLVFCTSNYETIKGLVSGINGTLMVVGLFLLFGLLAAVGVMLGKSSKANPKRRRTKNPSKNYTAKIQRKENQSDEEILRNSFSDLTGPEFERLLALYFRDQGYQVKEVGVGGNDGCVDLVITDRRGEKTAVQAKCYANHNTVGVSVVRELVGAKRNHDCILSLLVTTSDLTPSAKKEAEQFKVDYWHGALLEQKLKAWGRWQPGSKAKRTHRQTAPMPKPESQIAAAKETMAEKHECPSCGSTMVLRKSREGKAFYGCSAFPKCRQTRPV